MTNPEDAKPAPWYARVLPVSGLFLVLVALLAIVVPPFRDQLELSLNRAPQRYVELYFARSASAGGQVVCSRSGATVHVDFVVASHLEQPSAISWQASVRPSSRSRSVLTHHGALHTVPGQATGMRVTFPVPKKLGYTVSVTLPDQHQQVRARCPGRPS